MTVRRTRATSTDICQCLKVCASLTCLLIQLPLDRHSSDVRKSNTHAQSSVSLGGGCNEWWLVSGPASLADMYMLYVYTRNINYSFQCLLLGSCCPQQYQRPCPSSFYMHEPRLIEIKVMKVQPVASGSLNSCLPKYL